MPPYSVYNLGRELGARPQREAGWAPWTWLEEAVSKETPLLLGGENAGAAVTCVELGLGNVHWLVGLVKEVRRQSQGWGGALWLHTVRTGQRESRHRRNDSVFTQTLTELQRSQEWLGSERVSISPPISPNGRLPKKERAQGKDRIHGSIGKRCSQMTVRQAGTGEPSVKALKKFSRCLADP